MESGGRQRRVERAGKSFGIAMKRTLIESAIDAARPFYFRGKGRILNRIGPKAGTRACEVFGSTFALDLTDLIQRQIYCGTFEPRETELIRGLLQPGMTFVDAGANVGYYTALAAPLVGCTGRVIFLSQARTRSSASSKCSALTKLTNVTAMQAGVSDQAGHLKLYLSLESHNHTPTMVAYKPAACRTAGANTGFGDETDVN